MKSVIFQSTLPAWGATRAERLYGRKVYFNPRSPHGERLVRGRTWMFFTNFNPRSPHGERQTIQKIQECKIYFNPRSPHGERQEVVINHSIHGKFQSTLPAWGATKYGGYLLMKTAISIHAPRMGSDSTAKAYSNDRIKWSTLREPHFLYSKNACFSPIVSMCAATSRTKKSENQSFIRIISRLGAYVLHLRLVSVPQIIEPYAVRLLVHQHFQCGTK